MLLETYGLVRKDNDGSGAGGEEEVRRRVVMSQAFYCLVYK